MSNVATVEDRIASRIDPGVTGSLAVMSSKTGGLAFANMGQIMEFAKTMAIAQIAIPKHLRANPGACLGVVIQAVEWEMSPFAVANKSYSVNDRLAYEAQLINAVILRRAPIKGRMKVEFIGDGGRRKCRVSATLSDGTGDVVDYLSPEFDKITPKNSPLWKSDPDQQQFYYSSRAMCRRHFPDVLLGVYAIDEIDDEPPQPKDVTPRAPTPKTIAGRLDALAPPPPPHDPDTGEIAGDEQNTAAGAQPPAQESAAASRTTAAPDAGGGDIPEPSSASSPHHEAARKAARGGTQAFLDWRETAEPPEQDAADEIVEELAAIAKKADAEKAKGGVTRR